MSLINTTQKITNHKLDIIHLYVIFLVSVGFVYRAPRGSAVMLQTCMLIAFCFSKKDYFWLAFIFIIENFPGALFSRYTHDIQHTFSLMPTSPVGTLYFWMIFIIIATIKSFKYKQHYKFILTTNFILLAIWFGFLVINFGLYKWTAVTRTLLPWLFLFIMPRLLKEEADFVGFFNLIFSFVFFVLATQVFQVLFGFTPAKFLGGSDITIIADELQSVARPTDGTFIPYLALFGSLLFLTLKIKHFSYNYLLTISGLAIFSIFITATRSWLISVLFIAGGYLFFIAKDKSNIVRKLSIPFIMIILIIQFIPVVGQQVNLALQRYETVQFLLRGDVTAGGTLKRLDVRSPRVLDKFSDSPVVGWGYGVEAMQYSDGHVGNENLLMHTGIIGYLLWLALWLFFIIKMKHLNATLSARNPYKNLPILFILMLLAILIINASAQWFNYLLGILPGFTFIFLFTFASFVYNQARQYEYDQLTTQQDNN